MSCFIHFFVRKGDEFAPIGTYGRSTKVYEAFEALAPWEKIAPVTTGRLKGALQRLGTGDYTRNEIDKANERIDRIGRFSNSVEEKICAIHDELELIGELREDLLETEQAIAFCNFLRDIMGEAEYNPKLDMSQYVYVGMECGVDVDASMIENSKGF